MSTDPPPIAYAPHADPLGDAIWTGLRVATVAWAATVFVRHASYWSTLAVPAPGATGLKGLAMAESAVLVAVAAVAISARTATASRVRTLAILGVAFAALSAFGFCVDVSRLPPLETTEKVGRLVWMAATRAQVLAVPLALLVAMAAMAATPRGTR